MANKHREEYIQRKLHETRMEGNNPNKERIFGLQYDLNNISNGMRRSERAKWILLALQCLLLGILI